MPWLRLAFVSWLLLEALTFIAVARLIGWPGTFLLTLLGGLAGWARLKKAGTSALLKVRAAGRSSIVDQDRPLLEDALAAVGALALLLPGFLSDLVGLALASPRIRTRVASRVRGSRLLARFVRQPPGPRTIDLEPEDWDSDEARARPHGRTSPS
jgi:UPF0716 protein FxsA